MTLTERFGLPQRLVLDQEAAIGGEHARRTGRSWWALRYLDGRVLHEWDPDPASPNGHADWPNLAMRGLLKRTQALRLYCPNGRMAHAELPSGGDATGRLFQFKKGVAHFVIGAGGLDVVGRETLAHVIGLIVGPNGESILFAWEPLPEPPPPPGCPPQPKRPNYFNREQPTWALREQHERYLAEQSLYESFMLGEPMREWKRQLKAWEANGRGQLVGPIEDNVYTLSYRQIGRLSADHLGIADGEGR